VISAVEPKSERHEWLVRKWIVAAGITAGVMVLVLGALWWLAERAQAQEAVGDRVQLGIGAVDSAAVSTTVTHTLYLPVASRAWEMRLDPDDPDYVVGFQWGLEMVRAPAAWYVSTGYAVTVAVVDTGVDLAHPDLVDSLVAGWDIVGDDASPTDGHGHGTHVAGIVGAATNNALGVAGMGWGTKVMPVRVLDDRGEGDVWSVAQGIRYAVDHGARVINLSLGGDSGGESLADAIVYAQDRGAIVIAAAGNQNTSAPFYPAAYEGVIGVSATNASDEKASFSNYGAYVDVAAPGDSIYSTLRRPAGYGYMSGTSMAAPMVSGLAALLWTHHPEASAAQIVAAIKDGAADLGSEGWDPIYGWGRISAANSIYATLAPDSRMPDASVLATGKDSVQSDAAYRPGEVIVQMRGVSRQDELGLGKGMRLLRANAESGLYLLGVPVGSEVASAEALARDANVTYAHPNYLLYAADR
jgi:subtilisin family serine protease